MLMKAFRRLVRRSNNGLAASNLTLSPSNFHFPFPRGTRQERNSDLALALVPIVKWIAYYKQCYIPMNINLCFKIVAYFV